MATHSIILAWQIPWPEEPGRLQSMGPQKSQTWLSDWMIIMFTRVFSGMRNASEKNIVYKVIVSTKWKKSIHKMLKENILQCWQWLLLVGEIIMISFFFFLTLFCIVSKFFNIRMYFTERCIKIQLTYHTVQLFRTFIVQFKIYNSMLAFFFHIYRIV